jgi:hypothetical protein
MDEKVHPLDPESNGASPPLREGNITHTSTYIRPQERGLHDPNITFEEYHYYALRTRQEEKTLPAPMLNWREFLMRRKNAHNNEANGVDPRLDPAHHHTEVNFSNKQNRIEISDEEWTNASRAFRTASWGACEYIETGV